MIDIEYNINHTRLLVCVKNSLQFLFALDRALGALLSYGHCRATHQSRKHNTSQFSWNLVVEIEELFIKGDPLIDSTAVFIFVSFSIRLRNRLKFE